MESTIHMSYRFESLFHQKSDEAHELKSKIERHLSIAQQKYAHAKNDYEASLKKNGGPNENEVMHRQRAMEMYKQLYQKAQNYAESAKKLYQNIHGETDRAIWMSKQQRNKLEKSKEDGDNFLKKAISALNDYSK